MKLLAVTCNLRFKELKHSLDQLVQGEIVGLANESSKAVHHYHVNGADLRLGVTHRGNLRKQR